jgi:geranylgeranyl diphosphate synthase, type I
MSLNAYFQKWIPRIEAEMLDIVNASVEIAMPAELNTMLRYHLGFANADGSEARINGGKRIRPILALLCNDACDGYTEAVLPAAAGIELLHNFSLIHDDIEDGDETRRGRPTLWKQWNIPQAINAGDTMFALAHLAFQRSAALGINPARVLHALRVFDETNVHLTAGQHLDIGFERKNTVSSADYIGMIGGKTAALTKAACEIGAILGDGSEDQILALGEFGRQLGISFQLQDDVLGIWGDPAKTGKASSDLAHRKKTLPVLRAAESNPRIAELYFGAGLPAPTDAQVGELRTLIEATDARQHTEAAASAAYAKGLEMIDAVPVTDATDLLVELAKSLLGRTA